MKVCTILGHKWDETDERWLMPSTWTCERCGIETEDYVTPPTHPWIGNYPLEVDE